MKVHVFAQIAYTASFGGGDVKPRACWCWHSVAISGYLSWLATLHGGFSHRGKKKEKKKDNTFRHTHTPTPSAQLPSWMKPCLV